MIESGTHALQRDEPPRSVSQVTEDAATWIGFLVSSRLPCAVLKPGTIRAFTPWIPVICWMAVIFTASTDHFSAAHTSRIIEPILRWLFPHSSQVLIGYLHFMIRKGAHVTEYAILAILLSFAVERSERARARWKNIAIALGIAIVYAAGDEFHQTFVPSRGASVHDVMIDTGGAMVGLFLFWSVVAGAKGLRDPAFAPANAPTP